jgi:hypothetical protein
MAVSSIGVLSPCGISFPGLKLNKLEVSASAKTSMAEGRATRARRSANEIGDGSDEDAEASGLMALRASREKKRTFWPVPGVFGSRRIDLTLPSSEGRDESRTVSDEPPRVRDTCEPIHIVRIRTNAIKNTDYLISNEDEI